MAMQNQNSSLGDSMNFPESNKVKKREPLSNVIFKITKGMEKLNSRNERLLKLNLDYELKMLRLAKKKEQKISDKLECDKLCNKQINGWLFHREQERNNLIGGRSNTDPSNIVKRKRLKGKTTHTKRDSFEILSLPRLDIPEASPRSKNENHNSDSQLRLERISTAPGLRSYETSSISASDKRLTRKVKSAEPIKTSFQFEQFDYEAKYDEISSRSETGLFSIQKDIMPDVNEAENVERTIEKKQSFHDESALPGEVDYYEKAAFSKLLEKASDSTKKLSAFIPVDASYRRTCATRKKYQDIEGKRQRILTRYLREKREFEALSRTDYNHCLPNLNNKDRRLVVMHIEEI